MRIAAILSFVTAILIYSQLLTGGPFLILSGEGSAVGFVHSIIGFISGILAIIVVIAAWISKPAYKAFRYSSLVILILFILVGFAADKPANTILIHYELAVLLFGTAIAGTFYTFRWNKMPKPAAATSATAS